ncbi:MAG: PEP/pyruvate-binding domain-containing protein [Gammaproteobacteria bacterium]|nr:PEP/pyruvate-binding domain-containing protein [Gammaproteobacteria bacterium]
MSVLNLSDVKKTDIELVGGKGANLGELLSHGFPIPPGFIIVSAAYQEIFDSLDVRQELAGVNELPPREQEEIAQRIRQEFQSVVVPQSLQEKIQAAHDEIQALQDKPVIYAVRSSATAEDSANASFAGQHDTYYYVNNDSLLRMVKKCWGSLWTDAAMSYRSSQGIEHTSVRMAVVIQEMIQSDISGVTFTANPLTGDKDEIVSESTWGMGAAIVDGRVSPDRFITRRGDMSLSHRSIADKKFMVPARLEQPDSPRLVEVPLELRQKESLTPDQLATVTAWAIKAENHFGSPQDIEWSFHNNNFYMLQSRPITAMGAKEEDTSIEGQYVLFKAMAENFTGPLYPLTADLFIRSLPMMEMINGRVYLNMKYLKPLFPFKISDQQIANLAYLSNDRTVELKIAWSKLPKFLLILIVNYLISEVLYRRISNLPDDFMDIYRKRVDDVVADPAISANEVLTRLIAGTRFFEPAGNMAILVNIISASRYPLFMGILTVLLRRWLPDLRQDAESMLCSGAEGVLSIDMGRKIWQLAKIARTNEKVSNIIRDESPDKVLSKLVELSEATEFVSGLEEFKKIHGHRTLREFELQSVRWDEDPSTVIGMIRNYLLVDSNPDANPDAMEEKFKENRLTLEKEVKLALDTLPFEKALHWRWHLIDYLRNKTRYFVKQRENSRFYHILSFYGVRKKILQMEDKLIAAGALKCKDDIFYLKWEELHKLDAGEYSWIDVEDIIRERRIEQIRLTKLVPPRTIGVDTDVSHDDTQVDDQEIDMLPGQGASPGVYVGTARVILDPAVDAEIKPGEILVAPYTDPAWTPLFLIAHAAVVEVGSYLSHAGTIAREYGMPCVVDVEDCTSRIKTGDRIRVNGTLGRVEFTQVEEPP